MPVAATFGSCCERDDARATPDNQSAQSRNLLLLREAMRTTLDGRLHFPIRTGMPPISLINWVSDLLNPQRHLRLEEGTFAYYDDGRDLRDRADHRPRHRRAGHAC